MLIARHKLRLLIGVSLVAIAVLGLNALDSKDNTQTERTALSTSDIDFFIVDADFKVFDVVGTKIQAGTAAKIEHFKQQQKSHLTAPTISHFNTQNMDAKIVSDTALIQDQDAKISFQGHVLVTGYEQAVAQNFLKTTVLNYNHNENRISTDEDVEFTDTLGNISTATGLLSDINMKTVELKTNVKGTFNAKPSNAQ